MKFSEGVRPDPRKNSSKSGADPGGLLNIVRLWVFQHLVHILENNSWFLMKVVRHIFGRDNTECVQFGEDQKEFRYSPGNC